MWIAFFHQSEVFHAHLHLVVNDFVLISLQGSSLSIEEQQSQFGAKLLDKCEHRHDAVDLMSLQIEHFEREKLLIVV